MSSELPDDAGCEKANRWAPARLDRSVLVVESLTTATSDAAYRHGRSPAQRIAHIEFLRRLNYGDAASGRLQRVLEVVYKPWG